jgi:hypothetical protein
MISISKNIPTSADSDDVWLNWYKSMKDDFGKKHAKEAFTYIWASRGSSIANTNKLRDYMETQGVNIEAKGLVAKITDFGDDIFDRVGSMFKVGRIAVYVVGGVLLFAIGAFIIQIAVQPFKTLEKVGDVSNKNVESGAKMLN